MCLSELSTDFLSLYKLLISINLCKIKLIKYPEHTCSKA